MIKCQCESDKFKTFGFVALRLTIGAVLIYHGWGKLQSIQATSGYFDTLGIPAEGFFAWLVALLEFIGGIAIILGYKVKTFSLLIAIEMVIAILLVHLKQPWAQAELALLVLGGSLFMAGHGAGEWRMSKKECICKNSGKK